MSVCPHFQIVKDLAYFHENWRQLNLVNLNFLQSVG